LKNYRSRQRALRVRAIPLLLWLVTSAHAGAHKSEAWARTQFSTAEEMREKLNECSPENRTRQEYRRVMAAYRRVYYGAPASTKADPSVTAVAELLVEAGHRFDDDTLLRSAIEQYEFLRREYPGSKQRFEALFTIARIYKDDLGDGVHAREVLQEFLRLYPRHALADEARAALTEPVQQAVLKSKDTPDLPKPIAKHASSPAQESTADRPAMLTGIRHWATSASTRVAIDLNQDVKFESRRIDRPNRIILDLDNTIPGSALTGQNLDIGDAVLKNVRVAQFVKGKTRVVLDVDDGAEYHAFLLQNPPRLIIDIRRKESAVAVPATQIDEPAQTADVHPSIPTGRRASKDASSASVKATESENAKDAAPKRRIVEAGDDDDDEAAVPDSTISKPVRKAASRTSASTETKTRTAANKRKPAIPEIDAREARPTARGDRSLIRALGLKIGRIVIDPGHGGHDTGTIGPRGLEEKDLVLEVGRRLGKLLQARMGAEVVYTRRDDTFIPLETRTAVANQQQADLFVSIHANSSRDPDARGVETYYLNFTSSAEALEVAARENAVSENTIHELQDLVKKIALKEKIEESREFAVDVQRSLHSGLAVKSPAIRDRGVKQAPFIVLIGANMPSILAEISFVSNPTDERRLRTAEYRQRIAESLYRGIAKYVSGLSGVKVASRIEKEQGQ
jgi:N-acetylmuramoyl-L-alanine amidase